MKKFAPMLALGAALFLAPLQAKAEPLCRVMGSVMHDAMAMRERGYSQHQTANALSAIIGDAASNGRGSRAERQQIANQIGRASTYLLQLAYTVELRRGFDNAGFAADYVYRKCMRGEL
ncbi:MAG: hypothetical protein Q4G36_06955 [Paracoccus sp. (in: a-proteobacteria)]|nr:hypothetical protein [Paracoccus sp. (in: a-proteobacteria)]